MPFSLQMKKDCIWQAAKAHADHLHNQDHANPVADEAVPELEPTGHANLVTQALGDSIT